MTGNSTHGNPSRSRNNINTSNNLGDAFDIIPGSNVSLIALCVLSLWQAGRRLQLSDFPRSDWIRDAMSDQETL